MKGFFALPPNVHVDILLPIIVKFSHDMKIPRFQHVNLLLVSKITVFKRVVMVKLVGLFELSY